MGGDKELAGFKRKLLTSPPLIIAVFSLPMALGVIPPNPIYGFRTAASMASREAWYSANVSAGITGAALGALGAVLIHSLLRKDPPDTAKALMAAGISLSVALLSLAAGLLAS